jgi:ribonucleoside-diphosphate reductase alpha chain
MIKQLHLSEVENMASYISSFTPSRRAAQILQSGRITAPGETPAHMVERVVAVLAAQEVAFGSAPQSVAAFSADLGRAMDAGRIIFSTTILTNAGRHRHKSLTACTVPLAGMDAGERYTLEKEIHLTHQYGMGMGFNLDTCDDPVAMLQYLNAVAVSGAASGAEERPVGNMAVLSIYHPRIKDFIHAKMPHGSNYRAWKFNISIDVDAAFMRAAERGESITLRNGTKVDAARLLEDISLAATACGDPGIVFLDRMNARNALPALGAYKTTAPCGEVGLIEGETCQFGYLNVAKYASRNGAVDYTALAADTRLLTRALDNALEISIDHFVLEQSRIVAKQKRKIGIGLCGVADALALMDVAYDTPQARMIMQDILSFINFTSKQTSVELADERGSCDAMATVADNRHLADEPLIARLYGSLTTRTVSAQQWRALADSIATTRKLRHVSTIALPPAGRSALIWGASQGIEPYFAMADIADAVRVSLRGAIRRIVTAHSVSARDHIAMAAALQQFTDEAISKTVNVPSRSTSVDIQDIFMMAYKAQLSGITVYVDGSRGAQPKQLTAFDAVPMVAPVARAVKQPSFVKSEMV